MNRQHRIPTARHQGGISLVVVLVLLVAVSVLGIAVLRSSAMQERMSANLRDRNLAVQTTEAALRILLLKWSPRNPNPTRNIYSPTPSCAPT